MPVWDNGQSRHGPTWHYSQGDQTQNPRLEDAFWISIVLYLQIAHIMDNRWKKCCLPIICSYKPDLHTWMIKDFVLYKYLPMYAWWIDELRYQPTNILAFKDLFLAPTPTGAESRPFLMGHSTTSCVQRSGILHIVRSLECPKIPFVQIWQLIFLEITTFFWFVTKFMDL